MILEIRRFSTFVSPHWDFLYWKNDFFILNQGLIPTSIPNIHTLIIQHDVMLMKKVSKHLNLETRLRNYRHACSWWHHQMETYSALLAINAGNSPVTGEFHAQRPVTRLFDVIFDLRPNKRLSKQLWGWWFETPSRPLWCHSNVVFWMKWLSEQSRHDVVGSTNWNARSDTNNSEENIDIFVYTYWWQRISIAKSEMQFLSRAVLFLGNQKDITY